MSARNKGAKPTGMVGMGLTGRGIETIDRSFRNDTGCWATFAGPFRWMDLAGIPAYAAVMGGLLPKLCSTGKTPGLMREKESAKRREIHKLADSYDGGKI